MKNAVPHFLQMELRLINLQAAEENQVLTMDEAQVAYQFAEVGRVDLGGGGTIAYIMANYGMEVIDSGVAVLNMHAPYEVSSKADVYEAVKGYRAFLRME